MIVGVASVLALLLTGLGPSAPIASVRPQSAPETSTAQRAARFGEVTFPALADSFDVPGAVLTVVHADSIVARAGFGYGDLEAGVPVDPDRTLFRVGSVSKLVTATTVMRLVEQGLVDLHVDVNDLLTRVHVPQAFGRPVTAHDLLTHTAGFDERIFGSGTPGGSGTAGGSGTRGAAPDLERFLAETLPPRIFPPGQLHLYSNHGYGLLGLVASDVTGQPFSEVVRREVFAPLGMHRSTFAQPPPGALIDDLATGYVANSRGPVPLPLDYIAFGPAGSLTTTATDMARFMIFHLTGGAPGGGSIVADSTRRIMQGPRWRTHPRMPGMGYGFFGTELGRYRALRHRGGWPGWVAQFVLVPELDLGLFVAINTDDNGLVDALLERFAADVLGGPRGRPAVSPPGLAERAAGLVGHYRLARHDHGTFGKIAALLGLPAPDFRVEAAGDTSLVLFSGGAPRPMHEVEPFVFVEPGLDPQWFHFETDAEGRAVRLHASTASLERIGWWEVASVHRGLLAVGLAILLSALGAWLVSRFVSRIRKREVPATLARGRGLVAASAGCLLLFVVAVAVAVPALGPQGILQPFPLWFRGLFVLPPIGSLLGLIALPYVAVVWRHDLGSRLGRIHLAGAASAIVLLIPVLAYWNLLGVPW